MYIETSTNSRISKSDIKLWTSQDQYFRDVCERRIPQYVRHVRVGMLAVTNIYMVNLFNSFISDDGVNLNEPFDTSRFLNSRSMRWSFIHSLYSIQADNATATYTLVKRPELLVNFQRFLEANPQYATTIVPLDP